MFIQTHFNQVKPPKIVCTFIKVLHWIDKYLVKITEKVKEANILFRLWNIISLSNLLEEAVFFFFLQ